MWVVLFLTFVFTLELKTTILWGQSDSEIGFIAGWLKSLFQPQKYQNTPEVFWIWCSNMWSIVPALDWVFVSNLTLTRGLFYIGLPSHGQICLNLLLNNSVDLFYSYDTTESTGSPRAAFYSDIRFISSVPAHLFFSSTFFYAKVTEPQLLKSSIPSIHPSSHINPLCCSEGQIFDKSAEETVCS